MNFKFKNKSGITLIALIITIIVMLILVAVSISVALNTGLFKSASDATKNWKSAQDAEANVGSEIKIGDKTYSSIEEYIEDTKPLPEIKAGEKASETSKYQTAVIPKGFTVSNATGEKDVSTGLVIYDIPENELGNVKWDGTEKTKYNQFVWIPVEVNKTTEPKDTETSIASFYRSKWSSNARTTVVDSKYTEPNTTNDTNDKTGIASQIENLTKSIYQYGGFYIGRYEAGSVDERTSSTTGVTTLGIKQDMYPYNYVKWGESMSNIGEVGAVALSNSLYNSMEPNYGATSMLCTGACWDSMLDFIKNTKNVTSSANWGNYSDAEFDITRGKYAVYLYSNGTLGNFQNVNNKYPKAKNTFVLLTTGATERNSAKNIYDVAGNCYEWTTESYSSGSRVGRGGYYFCNSSGFPAYFRNDYDPTVSYGYIGFRVSLYVNL